MFNHAVTGRPPPKHVRTDHDPLFRFHCWQRYCQGLFEFPIAA